MLFGAEGSLTEEVLVVVEIRRHAAFVTIDRFGASAPYKVLYEKYGITVERVVAEAQRLLS